MLSHIFTPFLHFNGSQDYFFHKRVGAPDTALSVLLLK